MRVLIICATIFCLLSCSKKIQISGVYRDQDDGTQELVFDKENFLFRYSDGYNSSLFYCTDSLAWGTWNLSPNSSVLELNGDNYRVNSILESKVVERTNSDVRVFTLIIRNPIETHQNFINTDSRAISYGLKINSDCSRLSELEFRDRFNSSRILVDIPVGCTIKSFTITVYPTEVYVGWSDEYPPSMASTYSYELKSLHSNEVEVEMPNLTYCYVSAMRLKQDYVLILSKSNLRWNGKSYKKVK